MYTYICHVPFIQILIKGFVHVEHAYRKGKVVRAPSIQGMVEFCIGEHSWHEIHPGDIPTCHGLIVVAGKTKHVTHVAHVACIPGFNIDIKGMGILEHRLHRANVACAPSRNVGIKGMGTSKHVGHVVHSGGVPLRNVCVKGVLHEKGIPHISDTFGTPIFNAAVGGYIVGIFKVPLESFMKIVTLTKALFRRTLAGSGTNNDLLLQVSMFSVVAKVGMFLLLCLS